MRGKNKSSAFTPLFYLICIFLQIIAIELSAKDNTIDTVIKNGFYEVVVDKTGSEHYDQLLATYAKHISDIKPFNHQKINAYLKFINRNLKPYRIELEFSCNNTNNKGESNVCTGFLSLKKKEISGEFVFGTYLKKEAEQESSIEGASEHYSDPKFYPQRSYMHLNYKDLGFEDSDLQLLVGNKYHKNYQYEIKYTKSFQQHATSIIKASISHNNIDYLSDILHVDIKGKLQSHNLEENEVENYQSKASNLLLDTHYKFLHKDSVEYTVGYSYRYTSYSHLKNPSNKKLFLKDLPKYHINHVYAVSKILNHDLIFYIGYENDFSNKYRHIASAMFYKKSLQNYFFDLTIFNSDRKWKNENNDHYKVDDFYSSAKIGKKISVNSSIINDFSPYVILTYDNKSRRGRSITISKEQNVQQGLGVTMTAKIDGRLKNIEADLLYLNGRKIGFNKKSESILLSFNVKF